MLTALNLIPVISLLPEQMQVRDLLVEGTRVHALYNKPVVFERHRHRFEFNNEFREAFENNGFQVSGLYEPKDLVEVLELKDHPFYVGVQYFTKRSRGEGFACAIITAAGRSAVPAPTICFLEVASP